MDRRSVQPQPTTKKPPRLSNVAEVDEAVERRNLETTKSTIKGLLTHQKNKIETEAENAIFRKHGPFTLFPS